LLTGGIGIAAWHGIAAAIVIVMALLITTAITSGQDVSILNGPFSAECGDFSGLGVVQIRTRESLPDEFTLRTQAGSFDTYRTFFAYNPALDKPDAFLSYERAYTNGPFINHGRYKWNNFTGNYT
jgi:hypothetical protein